MRTIVGVTICLCGLALGGCGNLAGVTAGAPERVSVAERRAEPVLHYGGFSSPDDDSAFVDPVPRYLARAGIRQVALAPPRSVAAGLPAAQSRVDPATTGAATPRLPSGDAEPGSAAEITSSVSPEEQARLTAEKDRLNAQKRAEAMRAMNERIAARDREAKRSLSGICTGCR